MRTLIHGLFSRLGPPSDGDPGDDQLLSAFLTQRDESAFIQIVRRHGPMVHGVCRRVLGNEADADDAFQATFLVLVRKADTVHPRSRLGNWLYGVAVNVARKGRELAARRREKESASLSASVEREVEGSLEHVELRAVIDHELHQLPDDFRAAVVACDLEGQTRKEAAERLGWSEGTVASRLARGRAILAERLGRRGLTAPAVALGALLAPSPVFAASPDLFCHLTDGSVSPATQELANGVMRAMTTSKLKSAALLVLTVAGLGGVGAAVVLACGSTPWRPNPALQAAVGPGAFVPPPTDAKPVVLTNPAKDITVVSDRNEKFAEFFRRQKLMVAGLHLKDVDAALGAKEPTERMFTIGASYNETGPYSATFGAYVRVGPVSKPVAELLEPVVKANREKNRPVFLIFRPSAEAKDVWHIVGFTTRTTGVAFFTMAEKKAPDDFAPADLVRDIPDKK